MHEQVIFVHISLDKSLILLSISTSNDQVVFAGNEPNELLEPEDFTLNGPDLSLFEFLVVASCCFFSLLDGNTGSILRLDFLGV